MHVARGFGYDRKEKCARKTFLQELYRGDSEGSLPPIVLKKKQDLRKAENPCSDTQKRQQEPELRGRLPPYTTYTLSQRKTETTKNRRSAAAGRCRFFHRGPAGYKTALGVKSIIFELIVKAAIMLSP